MGSMTIARERRPWMDHLSNVTYIAFDLQRFGCAWPAVATCSVCEMEVWIYVAMYIHTYIQCAHKLAVSTHYCSGNPSCV